MINELLIKKNNFIKKKIIIKEELTKLNKQLKETNCLLNKICKHDWVIDYIDKPFGEGSIQIKYCYHCELTK